LLTEHLILSVMIVTSIHNHPIKVNTHSFFTSFFPPLIIDGICAIFHKVLLKIKDIVLVSQINLINFNYSGKYINMSTYRLTLLSEIPFINKNKKILFVSIFTKFIFAERSFS